MLNKCAKKRENFTEKSSKAIPPKLENLAKKRRCHARCKKTLYFLMILTLISLKIEEESKTYSKFINFNEFFGAKKSSKAISPNWCFSQKLLGIFSCMPKTLVFSSNFAFDFFQKSMMRVKVH